MLTIVDERTIKPVQVYASSQAKREPVDWAAENAGPVSTFPLWHTLSPTMVEQFQREREANGGLDITQVPRDLSVVAWYWRCDRGHRWRETTYSRLDLPVRVGPTFRNVRRWKSIAGTRAACRKCVLEDYGATYAKCGHPDLDLNNVNKPPRVFGGWCGNCRDSRPLQPGDALLVDYAPPTSLAENTLRALVRVQVPLVTPAEANAVRVRPTAWGALHVFPDMLIPSKRIAIEYDSPGEWESGLSISLPGTG